MVAIKQGQLLTESDLPIYLHSKNHGCYADPYSIVYDYYICDECGSGPLIVGPSDRIPVKFGIGQYYPALTIDTDETVGAHKIVWKWKETETDVWHTAEIGFDVIPSTAVTGRTYPENLQRLIYELRKKLRDINPDRDYFFAPPSSNIARLGFSQTRGYRWSDEQLANHIIQAINYINLYPPITCYSSCDLPCLLEPIILLVAAGYAFLDLASLWIHEEFDYSVNGISLTISRSDKYQNLANTMFELAERNLERQKLAIARVIKGLRQSRYTFSRGTFLGPYTSGRNMRHYIREG